MELLLTQSQLEAVRFLTQDLDLPGDVILVLVSSGAMQGLIEAIQARDIPVVQLMTRQVELLNCKVPRLQAIRKQEKIAGVYESPIPFERR